MRPPVDRDVSQVRSSGNALSSPGTRTQIMPFQEHAPSAQGDPSVKSFRRRLLSLGWVSISTFVPEMFEDLLPTGAIFSELQKRNLWSDAASTVAGLLWDSALAGVVAWSVNYIFSSGNFFSGQAPAKQSYASFCGGVVGTMSFTVAATLVVSQAASMVRLHFADNPHRHPTLGQCIRRLIRQSFKSYLVSLAFVVGSGYGMASLPASTHAYRLHFYVSAIFLNFYTVNLDLAYRRIFLLETVEGNQRTNSKRGSYAKRVLRMMVKDSLFTFTIYLGAVYIHLSSYLHLETAAKMTTFSIASYAFKLVTQEVTKAIVLHQKKTNVKTIYLSVAVPTVLIDTQIRTMLLRQSNLSQSMTGSIALAIVETLFRFAKVWLIRFEIWLRERRVTREIEANSRTLESTEIGGSQEGKPSTRWWHWHRVVHDSPAGSKVYGDPQYLEFLHWRRRLLRFHAAEIHADMYAEYLAIVCSTSIYFFYHTHPKYAWTDSESGTKSSLSGLKGQATYLGLQVAMELAVDFFSCLWELANGVPMQNSKQMRGFIAALFVSCSIANIMLFATVSIRSGS